MILLTIENIFTYVSYMYNIYKTEEYYTQNQTLFSNHFPFQSFLVLKIKILVDKLFIVEYQQQNILQITDQVYNFENILLNLLYCTQCSE